MALTRITKGVIKPNENYDTHNINSTGIVTAIGLDVNGNGDISGNLSVGGVLTYEDVTSIDSVGIITAQKDIHVGAGLSVVGVSTFSGDLYIDENIIHTGDTDTKIRFANAGNIIQLQSGGTVKFQTNSIGAQIDSTLFLYGPAGNPGRLRLQEGGALSEIRGVRNTDSNSLLYFDTEIAGTTATRLIIDENGHLKPSADSTYDLGINGTRWRNLYADTYFGNGNLGILTATNIDLNGDLDVDGHTELDNVNIAGVTTTATVNISTNARLNFASNNRLQITSNGTNSYFDYAGTLNVRASSGSSTALNFASNGNVNIIKDLDVDGHTNLDNVSIAGVATATTFVGALTGTASGNPTLTSGANNRVITATGANALTGESDLTFDGGTLGQTITSNGEGFVQTASGNNYTTIRSNSNRTGANNTLLNLEAHWNGTNVASIAFGAGEDTTNKDDGIMRFFTKTSGASSSERLRITSSGRIEIGTGTGVFSTAPMEFKVSSSSGWTNYPEHISLVDQKAYDAGDNGGGIVFSGKFNSGGSATTFGGIHCKKENTTDGHYGGSLHLLTRTHGGANDEKLHITSGGQVRLPINGQQLTWGSSQQMKFYYENSEERMYLKGDGEYGFAFRVNNGNALEINKTTRDVIMQGSSGRNFQWDNSEPSLYLTDNGTTSARLKIGSSGDLQMYHDVSGNLNHITAATNGTIKISGGVEFWDYTGVTKRAVIDSNGLRIGAVSAPTLPTTGQQPMIMRSATHFTKEIHRTISDYRGLCDGSHSGYLLLIPAYISGSVNGKKFYGTITCDRGSTGSGNSTQVATVHASTAYQDDKFFVDTVRNAQYIVSPAKVTYNGTQYLALKFGQSGGGPNYGIHIDGHHRGTDSNFLRIVRTNELDSVQNDNHGAIANTNSQHPICGVMVTGMNGANFNNDGYLRGGSIHFEYSPAGTDCYDNGIFTARVNGIYHATAGILTGNNVGRVEGAIQRKVTGGNWQNIVNFNGAGNFSNSHNGPTATGFIKMKAGWQLRVGRVSSNQGAYGTTHDNHYFGAVLMHGLTDGQV